MRGTFNFQRLKLVHWGPLRIGFVAFSLVSLALQPVAFGQTQEKWANKAIQDFVKQNKRGTKRITVKEFWEQNKTKLNPHWQKEFFPAINIEKDEMLPEMDLVTVKGPGGQETLRLVLTLANKKTVSIEFLGGQEKFARINNQVISYQDFYEGTGFMEKITQDPVVQQQARAVQQKAARASILPSYALYSSLTGREKAEYFANVRFLIEAADQVVQEASGVANSQKKESASFIQLLLEKAYANNTPRSWLGKGCIVGGYVGKYIQDRGGDTKGSIYCSHTEAIENFANTNASKGMTQNRVSGSVYDNSCGSGNLRCNPFVYGYDRGHGSLCVRVDRRADSFQRATQTCDNASPLRRNSLASDTEAMIKTLLGKENKSSAEFFKDGKVISEEKYNELKNSVVKEFDLFINEALATCGANKDGTTRFGEKNQGGACKSLYERKLAFMEGFELLKGKYDKPTPTPAPPVTVPPIANEPDPCRGMPPEKAAELKNSDGSPRCPGAVVPPPPVATKPDCNPMMTPDRAPAADSKGEMNCVPRAAPIGGTDGGKKDRERKKGGFDCSFICPLGVMALFGFAAYKFTRSKQTNKPMDYTPPTPPPVLPPAPQPPSVTPVPPISPILPAPAPTGGETAPSAQPGGPSGMGTR